MSYLVSVSSSGYLSTTLMISRHTKPMQSIFFSPIFSLQKEILNYGPGRRGHNVTLLRWFFLSEWMGEVNTDTKCDGFCRVCPKVPARTEWKARWFPKFTEWRSEFLPLMFLCCNACSCLQTYFMPRTYRLFGYSSLSFINIQVLLYFKQFPACW